MKLVDDNQRRIAKRQYTLTVAVFVSCTVLFVTATTAILLLSNWEYLGSMLGNIALTIVYGGYLVYFTSALLPARRSRYRFFVNLDNGTVSAEIVYVEDNTATPALDKYGFYQINARVIIDAEYNDIKLFLYNKVNIPTGKLTVKLFSKVVLEYEVANE